MNVLVVDVGGTNVKILATGADRAAQIPVGPDADRGQDGGGRPKIGERLEVRRRRDRLPGPGRARPTGRRAAQPRARDGSGFDYRRHSGAGQDHQRCGDAGARQLQGREAAVPRPRHRSRHDAHRRWHRRADGARPPSVQEAPPTRTTSGCAVSNGSARRNGGDTSPMSWPSCVSRSSPKTSCSAAATSRN